jgi:hypothetical protein
MANPSVDVSGAQATDAWRVRIERWRRVRHLLDSAALGTGRLRQECVQAAGSILQLLAPEEEAWDFPSVARVMALRQLVAGGDIEAAAAEARDITDALDLWSR